MDHLVHGKSSLANLLADKYGYQIIRIDTLRKAFSNVFPNLNITSKAAVNHSEFKKFVQHFFDINVNYHRNTYPFILEGCDITIEDYRKMFHNNRTLLCVLGLSDITPEALLANIRKYDSVMDWSTKYDDEYMLRHCNNYISSSKENKILCEKYGFSYFETSYNRENALEQVIDNIKKHLLK